MSSIRQELSVIVSPVFSKELIQLACSRRTFALRCTFITVLCAVAYYCIPVDEADAAGLALFRGILATQIVAIFIFAPMLTAGSVAGERESRTLNLLLTTRLTTWNIVQDKGLSRLAYLLFICEFTLPFMFLAVMLGGVAPAQVVGAMLRVFNVALVCGGLGIYFSTLRKRFIAAMASTYVYLFVAMYLISAFWYLERSKYQFTSADTLHAPIEWFNTVMLDVVSLANPWSLVPYTMFAAMAYAFGVGQATACINRDREEGRLEDEKNDEDQGLGQQRVRLRPVRFVGGAQRAPNRLIRAVETDPDAASRMALIGIPLVGIIIYQILTNADFQMFMISLAMPVIFAITLLKSACAFTHERSRMRMDLLLTCGIRGPILIRNAYLSLIGSLIPVWSIFVGLRIAAIVTVSINPAATLLQLFGPIFLFLAVVHFIAVLSMTISIRCETNARAITCSAAAFLLVTAAPALIRTGGGAMLSPTWHRVLHCLDFFRWFSWTMNPAVVCPTGYYAIQLLAYTIPCIILLGTAALRFNRWVNRQAD